MSWKMDGDHIVAANGHPVWIDEDGTEVPFDRDKTVAKIAELNEEAKSHRLKAKEANEKLEAFKGIDDPKKALDAMATVKNLEGKQMMEAGEVEKLKDSIRQEFKEQIDQIKADADSKLKERDAGIASRDETISKLLIDSAISTDPWLGENSALPRDFLVKYFRDSFKVETLENGKQVAVGYHPDGNKVLSKQSVGDVADFSEALKILVGNHPDKDRILKGSGGSGSGTPPSSGGSGGGKTMNRKQFEAMSPVDQMAYAKGGGTVTD